MGGLSGRLIASPRGLSAVCGFGRETESACHARRVPCASSGHRMRSLCVYTMCTRDPKRVAGPCLACCVALGRSLGGQRVPAQQPSLREGRSVGRGVAPPLRHRFPPCRWAVLVEASARHVVVAWFVVGVRAAVVPCPAALSSVMLVLGECAPVGPAWPSRLRSSPCVVGASSFPVGGRRFPREGAKTATWLILPVVICLSQRLSHACLSINCFIL